MSLVQIHATALALEDRAVLLRGPSGSGKSDLALRLIQRGGRLVADDRVDLRGVEGRILASPPGPLAGLLEVRGIGIVKLDFVADIALAVVIDLVPADAVPRLPDADRIALLDGIDLPLYRLAPFEDSAPEKVALAVRACSGSILLGL